MHYLTRYAASLAADSHASVVKVISDMQSHFISPRFSRHFFWPAVNFRHDFFAGYKFWHADFLRLLYFLAAIFFAAVRLCAPCVCGGVVCGGVVCGGVVCGGVVCA
jgi:hypothetical protein